MPMDTDVVQAEISRLLEDDRRHARRQRAAAYLACAIGLATASGALSWSVTNPGVSLTTSLIIAICAAAPALGPVLYCSASRSRWQAASLHRLIDVGEPRHVLEALRALHREMPWTTGPAGIAASVRQMLIALTGEDGAQRSPESRGLAGPDGIEATKALRLAMRPGYADQIRVYVRLAGLIGDAGVTAPLAALASLCPQTEAQERIRREAVTALSALRARLDGGGALLLRPASGDAEALLRPGGEDLLRPAQAEAAQTREDSGGT